LDASRDHLEETNRIIFAEALGGNDNHDNIVTLEQQMKSSLVECNEAKEASRIAETNDEQVIIALTTGC
jgi:hypothetical protein